MTNQGLQPDISGYIAHLGTEGKPLPLDPSHLRALLYAALNSAGATKAGLQQITQLAPLPIKELAATQYVLDNCIQQLTEFAKADFAACFPGSDDLGFEDWKVAIDSFLRARTERYVNPETLAPILSTEDDPGTPEAPEGGVAVLV